MTDSFRVEEVDARHEMVATQVVVFGSGTGVFSTALQEEIA